MKKMLELFLIVFLTGCATTATNVNKDKGDSHYKMGLAYLNTPEDYMAMSEFQKAKEANPEDHRVYYAISAFFIKKGKLSDAEENIVKALNLSPDNAEYRNTYASILAGQGKIESAISEWKKALEDPSYPSVALVNYNIGLAYFNTSRYSQALKYLNDSVKMNPKVIAPILTLYRTYINLKDNKSAENTLVTGIQINPSSLELKMELGRHYYNNRNYTLASKQLMEIIDLNPKTEYAKEAAYLLKSMGIYNE